MYFDAEKCGQRIRDQIKVSGYTQEEFAATIGVSLPHLKNLMRGVKNTSIDYYVEIACVLGVSTDYLLLGQEKEHIDVRNELLGVIGKLSSIAQKL